VLAALLHKSCNRDFMEYRAEMKNRFHVIEKDSGKVLKTEYISSEPFFFLHIVNCFEEGSEIVVDICAFPNANCINLNLDDFRNGNEGPIGDLAQARRYVIPLMVEAEKDSAEGVNLIKTVKTSASAVRNNKSIILHYECLTAQGIEVPVVKNWGKKYKIFFGGGPRTVGPYKSGICKFNTETKESVVFRLDDNDFLGEPLFVPNPDGNDEDDGILITCLTRAIEGHKCGIVFIDAKSMTEMARAEFNNFVPLAIHGIFLPPKRLP
jgi:beta,beta-carotene 9',10'-dioxygenase